MARKRNLSSHEEAVRARASSKKLTNAKAASKLRAKAEAYLRRSRSLFASASLRDMIESDYARLKNIAADIRAGDLADAYQSAGRLDSAVRDEIPLDVWMYIGGRGVHE